MGIGHSNTLCGWVGTQAAIRRPDVLKENPGIAFGAVGKLMGEEWRAMPEHQKAPYVAKAEAAKAQYDIDKANYGSATPKQKQVALSRQCLRLGRGSSAHLRLSAEAEC